MDLDEVIFIPAGQNPFKEAQKPEEREHCFQMLSLAVEDNPAFRISRVEMDKLENPTPSIRWKSLKQSRMRIITLSWAPICWIRLMLRGRQISHRA